MGEYFLLSKDGGKVPLSLPEDWTVLYFPETGGRSARTAEELTEKCIEEPVGTSPLRELADRSRRIVVLVDDDTRPTPVKAALRTLLSVLEESTSGEIVILIALGTHEPMSEERLERRLGAEVLSKYPVIQHDAWARDLVPLPVGGGDTVRINPHVAMADLKIGIGSCLPHPMAGFGGGPKLIVPGASDYESTKRHHMLNTIRALSMYGVCRGNPFYEGIVRAVSKVGFDFSINFVYNPLGEPVGAVAGGMPEAFEQACEMCLTTLGFPFRERVDVTIASSFPHLRGAQFAKGLMAPSRITKEDGSIILFLPFEAPPPSEFFECFHLLKQRWGERVLSFVGEVMERGEAFLQGRPLEFSMAVASVLFRPPRRTIVVSDALKEEDAVAMGFEYAPSIEEAMRSLHKLFPSAKVAVIPAGGLLAPVSV
jgi:nickel-dependent lactate racemase